MKLLIDSSTGIPIGAAIAMALSFGTLIGVLISVAVFVLIQRRILFNSNKRKAKGLSYAVYENEENSENYIVKKDNILLRLVRRQQRSTPKKDKTFKYEEKKQGQYENSDHDTYSSIDDLAQFDKKDKAFWCTDKQTEKIRSYRYEYLSPVEATQDGKENRSLTYTGLRKKECVKNPRDKYLSATEVKCNHFNPVTDDTYISPVASKQDDMKGEPLTYTGQQNKGYKKNYRDMYLFPIEIKHNYSSGADDTYISPVAATKDDKTDETFKYTYQQEGGYKKNHHDSYLSPTEVQENNLSPVADDHYTSLKDDTYSYL